MPTKEELPEYRKFEHLKGQGISIRGASEKYSVPYSTLRVWIQHGYIKKIGQVRTSYMLDEQDVAYCVEIYKRRGGGQGKWIFNPDGTPWKKY